MDTKNRCRFQSWFLYLQGIDSQFFWGIGQNDRDTRVKKIFLNLQLHRTYNFKLLPNHPQAKTHLQHEKPSSGKVQLKLTFARCPISSNIDPEYNIFRILWIGILIASYFGIVLTCLYQWERFEARPTVISLARDFRNWNVTLPAMTVCYGNKVNESLAQQFIEKLFYENEFFDLWTKFHFQLQQVERQRDAYGVWIFYEFHQGRS